MLHNKRKKDLLQVITKSGLDGYIIPSNDSWQNEYSTAYEARLRWLTGFDGSNGVAIITDSQCYLYTDSRYLLQAQQQVDKEYTILDMNNSASCFLPKLRGKRVGYDPMLFSVKTTNYYQKWAQKNGIILEKVTQNPIDILWLDRPLKVKSEPYIIPSDVSAQTKLNQLFAEAQQHYTLICKPETICWLLNIRAKDLEYTPIMLSYLLLNNLEKTGEIFIDLINLDPKDNFYSYLKNLNIECFNLADLSSKLQEVKEQLTQEQLSYFSQAKVREESLSQDLISSSIILEPYVSSDWRDLPFALYDIFASSISHKCTLGQPGLVIDSPDPCLLKAAIKSPNELENIKQAHILDGAAVTKFLIWLYNHKSDSIDEITAATKLLDFRKQMPNFQGESFPAISAYGPNAAIVHYRPSPETNRLIEANDLYLIDSGGQYLYGTTDVTRTICLGTASMDHKQHFTNVLRGHILLANTKFPQGTTGGHLDAFARYHLWQQGLDYGHSTGHGVGYFLSVHEGPQAISRKNDVPLQVGMIVSIEPGLYLEGQYGIRIENLYHIEETNQGFMKFAPLTLVPIDMSLVEFYLLTSDEKEWLHQYHDLIFEKISSFFSKEEIEGLCKII